jgi:predicted nucleic acid-binding protein
MIIIDTGAFLAILNHRDPSHQHVQTALQLIIESLLLNNDFR